jgi:ribosomal protein L4
VKALDAKAVNVYDILSFDHLIVDSKIFENKILGAIA